MRAFKVFIFGLLYGWFFKVAFDRIYRQNELDDIRNENASLKEYIQALEGRRQSQSPPSEPAHITAQPKPLPNESMAADVLVSPPAPQPTGVPGTIPTVQAPAEPFDVPTEAPPVTSTPSIGAAEGDRDDLKIIKGIGPAIERKLNNAGIYTFAALAALKKKDLEDVLGSQVKRLQDENDLLAQARRLSKDKANRAR